MQLLSATALSHLRALARKSGIALVASLKARSIQTTQHRVQATQLPAHVRTGSGQLRLELPL
jgi:hypothetical protein